jgi:glycosyltransferase involved in cell wall biosynthesis
VGAIPICTDVGAVSELIANGIDGVLIDGDGDDGVAERFSEAIERMVEDDAWRRTLARAAIDRNGDNVWSRNFRELIAYIERETRDGNSGRDVVSETI